MRIRVLTFSSHERDILKMGLVSGECFQLVVQTDSSLGAAVSDWAPRAAPSHLPRERLPLPRDPACGIRPQSRMKNAFRNNNLREKGKRTQGKVGVCRGARNSYFGTFFYISQPQRKFSFSLPLVPLLFIEF